MRGRAVAWAVVVVVISVARIAGASPLRVGSKRFTESYILAEIAAQTVQLRAHAEAVHVQGLGATAIAFKALEEGAIDVYPDYTGTIAEAILGGVDRASFDAIGAALDARGLGILGPLGFENTYAIAVRRAWAQKRGLRTITDLAGVADLRVAVSHEFLGRSDGWNGLAALYGLAPREVRAMDHGLAYAALANDSVDATDAYSTDAKIDKLGLSLLADDRGYFPSYQACFLYRRDARARFPEAFAALAALRGSIDAAAMRAMNGEAELDGRSFADVAHDFVARPGAPVATADVPKPTFTGRLVRSIVTYGPRHVALVAVSLLCATILGIALGVVAARSRASAAVILGVAGVVQAVPSLALFCLLIPLFGIGVVPALVALFVYGLLPIARNTCAGLVEIPAPLRDSARALGLTRGEILWLVELPLASRTILAGIKTSAVLAVGTATVAAFIGAGGFGEPISIGLNLDDTPTMLEGAIPAALLALLVQGIFDGIDRLVVPRGLRVATARESR